MTFLLLFHFKFWSFIVICKMNTIRIRFISIIRLSSFYLTVSRPHQNWRSSELNWILMNWSESVWKIGQWLGLKMFSKIRVHFVATKKCGTLQFYNRLMQVFANLIHIFSRKFFSRRFQYPFFRTWKPDLYVKVGF